MNGIKIKRPEKLKRDGGVSLVELIIVLFLFAVVGIMTYGILVGTARTNLFLESHNDLGEFGQRLVNQIKTEALQSKRLLDNSTAGNEYLAALDLTGAPNPLDSTTLPTIEVSGSFSPSMVDDTENPFVATSVGNALLFAESIAPYVDAANNTRIDIYRFNFYYLSNNNNFGIAGKDHTLDIMHWQSIQFANYDQLKLLENHDTSGAALAAALSGLQAADPATEREAITYAWAPARPVGRAFYDISGATSLPDDPDSTYTIVMGSIREAIANLNEVRIGGDMPYTVAFNSGENFPINEPVPLFATANDTGDGFPNGLETMIAGPSGGRKVFIRLVLVADNGGGSLAAQENVVLINAMDF
jgi:hypothetical protein